MSQDKQKDAFLQSLQAWSAIMADNKDNSKYGYVDIQGVDLQPYNTTA